MVESNQSEQSTQHEPEPTRPTWKMLAFVVAIVVVAEVVTHWSDIASYTHLPQIMHSL